MAHACVQKMKHTHRHKKRSHRQENDVKKKKNAKSDDEYSEMCARFRMTKYLYMLLSKWPMGIATGFID